MQPLLGDAIFTQDGLAWKHSRDLLRPQFKEIRTKAFTLIRTQVDRMISGLGRASGDGIDLQPYFFNIALDTTMTILFGDVADQSRLKAATDDLSFSEAFDFAQHRLDQRVRMGNLYWLLSGRRFRRSCRIVHDFAESVVDAALKSVDDPNQAAARVESERYVFLDALLEQTRDRKVLRDQLISVLLAGRDTTACLLSWTL